MNAINKTRTQVRENANATDSASRAAITLLGGASALIGLWSVACLVGATISNGPIGLVKAYFSAVTGV